jgi:hypothetical protein
MLPRAFRDDPVFDFPDPVELNLRAGLLLLRLPNRRAAASLLAEAERRHPNETQPCSVRSLERCDAVGVPASGQVRPANRPLSRTRSDGPGRAKEVGS